MLISAHIHNFRSCIDVRVDDIGSMLVLLGRNGVGKTNILLALEWAAQVGSSTSGEAPDTAEGTSTGDVTLQLKLNSRTFEYWLRIELIDQDSAKDEYVAPIRLVSESLVEKFDGGGWISLFAREGKTVECGPDKKKLEISSNSPAAFAVASLLPNDPATESIKQVMGFLAKLRYLPLDTPAREDSDNWIVRESEYVAWKARTARSNDDIKQLQIQVLDLYLNYAERYAELVDLVGEKGLGIISNLQISEFKFPMDGGKRNEIYYFVRWNPVQGRETFGHSFSDLSYGTRRLLRLFVIMLHERPTVLLIEQPEDGIHKGLLHKLIPTLESYCEVCQLFVATHAADILNRARPEQIRLVSMSSGETAIRTLTSDELDAAHTFVRDEGALADFLDLVEG